MKKEKTQTKKLIPKLEVSFIRNETFSARQFQPNIYFALHCPVFKLKVVYKLYVKRFLGNKLRDRANLMIYILL